MGEGGEGGWCLVFSQVVESTRAHTGYDAVYPESCEEQQGIFGNDCLYTTEKQQQTPPHHEEEESLLHPLNANNIMVY
jgi:hypothetical protein